MWDKSLNYISLRIESRHIYVAQFTSNHSCVEGLSSRPLKLNKETL